MKGKVMDSLKDFFRPEFLNRLDDIIIFDVLSKESIEEIVKMQLEIVRERLEEKEIDLYVSQPVVSYLAKEGFNPQYGARPLKRLIQNKIMTPIANEIITQGIKRGGSVSVGLKQNGEFSYQVKKGRKGSLVRVAEELGEEVVG
jgi:ATP-dependent Clp protease ATP-binding subunit ClpA